MRCLEVDVLFLLLNKILKCLVHFFQDQSQRVMSIQSISNFIQNNKVLVVAVTVGLYAMKQKETMSKKLNVDQEPMRNYQDQFRFEQGIDSPGNDLAHFARNDVYHLKKACQELTACRGFNTKGTIKHTIVSENKRKLWSRDPTDGLYIKKFF